MKFECWNERLVLPSPGQQTPTSGLFNGPSKRPRGHTHKPLDQKILSKGMHGNACARECWLSRAHPCLGEAPSYSRAPSVMSHTQSRKRRAKIKQKTNVKRGACYHNQESFLCFDQQGLGVQRLMLLSLNPSPHYSSHSLSTNTKYMHIALKFSSSFILYFSPCSVQVSGLNFVLHPYPSPSSPSLLRFRFTPASSRPAPSPP